MTEEWEDWDDEEATTTSNNFVSNSSTSNSNSNQERSYSVAGIQLPKDLDIHDSVITIEREEIEREERIEETLNILKEFQKDLADQSVLDRINRRLASITYDQFMSYYQDNHKLSLYTIETELKRMNFSVFYEGEVFKTEDGIIDVYDRTRLNDIWKMANQSIYAELLLSLQKQFFRQDLCISFVSTESTFCIDMDNSTLSTQSSFRIMTMSDDAAAGATPRTPHGTLQLASVAGEIKVDLRRRSLLQRVYNSSLQMVFEADLRKAAIAISKLRVGDSERLAQGEQPRFKLVESINDIRNKLVEIKSKHTQKAEAIKEKVKSVQKASGSLLSGVLEGMVWSLGNIVGANKSNGVVDFGLRKPDAVALEALPESPSLASSDQETDKLRCSSEDSGYLTVTATHKPPCPTNAPDSVSRSAGAQESITSTTASNDEEWDDWDDSTNEPSKVMSSPIVIQHQGDDISQSDDATLDGTNVVLPTAVSPIIHQHNAEQHVAVGNSTEINAVVSTTQDPSLQVEGVEEVVITVVCNRQEVLADSITTEITPIEVAADDDALIDKGSLSYQNEQTSSIHIPSEKIMPTIDSAMTKSSVTEELCGKIEELASNLHLEQSPSIREEAIGVANEDEQSAASKILIEDAQSNASIATSVKTTGTATDGDVVLRTRARGSKKK